MTTPDTSAVRAWARSNGFEVADRGRLPVEVTDAYLAAHGTSGSAKAPTATAKPAARTSAAKKPAAKKATGKKPAARKAAPKGAAKKAAAAAPGDVVAPAPVPEATAVATKSSPPLRGAPAPVAEDRRLVALGEQLAALTERVGALEKAVGGKASSAKKTPRFRRSR